MLRRIRTRKEENELWEVEVALFLTLENTIQPTTNDDYSLQSRNLSKNKSINAHLNVKQFNVYSLVPF